VTFRPAAASARFAGLALVLSVAISWPAAGCVDAPAAPTQYAPFSQTDVRVGTGATAVEREILTVLYTGWLYDASARDTKGPVFDASAPGSPLSFVLGQGDVIAGWDQGLVGMRVGGVRRLIIPPSLGYGETRQGIVPPNATLVFDVELLSVGTPPAP
jgi:FKBP-type peptidyl-prolyl cis-trans isomerase FkpA